MAAALLLALFLALAPTPAYGIDCDTSAPASTRLQSVRPLRIASYSGYPTYSNFLNGTFLNGTYDASLLYQLQLQLGFTFEPVVELARGANQTWNQWVEEVLHILIKGVEIEQASDVTHATVTTVTTVTTVSRQAMSRAQRV